MNWLNFRGVSRATIGRIERGDLSPKVEYLDKINDVLYQDKSEQEKIITHLVLTRMQDIEDTERMVYMSFCSQMLTQGFITSNYDDVFKDNKDFVIFHVMDNKNYIINNDDFRRFFKNFLAKFELFSNDIILWIDLNTRMNVEDRKDTQD